MATYTKVNLEQLDSLISALHTAKQNINNSLQDYQNQLKIIANAGYISGVGEDAVMSAVSKIIETIKAFENTETQLDKKVTDVKVKTQEIEKEEATKAENVYEQDPTTYSKKTTETNKTAEAEKAATTENKVEETPAPAKTIESTTGGKTTTIPDSVSQTGIIANYTQNYSTRSWGWDQGKLNKAYNAAGAQTDGNMATLNGRYMVAVSPKFGKVGDNIDIKLENGQTIPAIIADVKGSDATSEWGHKLGGSVDVVEWEINGTSQSQLSSNLHNKGWYGVEVDSITNKGSGNYF